jgi:RND family efflux transporter MFP subunit
MTADDSASTNGNSVVTPKTLIRAGLILIVGIVMAMIIFASEPDAKREGATRKTAMLVQTSPVTKGEHAARIDVLGTVIPAREIELAPRVSGEITMCHVSFTPGGYVPAGQVLLKIDPADYEVAVSLAKSDLARARAEFKMESGRQEIARQDFKLLEDRVPDFDESLVLRKPQLEIADAAVKAAEAALERAKLDLERTEIKAPFDALVTKRLVNTGSQVSPGMALATLVDVSEYWIKTTVPLAQVDRLDLPLEAGKSQASAVISHEGMWPNSLSRTGTLYALTGELAESTRMAELLISLPDPLAQKKEHRHLPRLVLGTYVNVELMTRPMTNVIELTRDVIRKGNTVWVMKDNKLDIRKVSIAFANKEFAYISDGLEDGDKVVITHLSKVVQDAPLRTGKEEDPPNE